MTTTPNLQAITRLEIIDSTGRAYTAHNARDVTAVIQDDDHTLKIFATTTATPHTDTTATRAALTDLDLTEAVEAAAERLYTDYRTARLSNALGTPGSKNAWEQFPEWADLPVMDQHAWREQVRGVVIAAAPAIARSALATKETPDA